IRVHVCSPDWLIPTGRGGHDPMSWSPGAGCTSVEGDGPGPIGDAALSCLGGGGQIAPHSGV
ncbi:MAG TPA: hypothetical protein VN764_18870, partial [Polyangiaceae bacterium]|nr:hypothetical protein [Polyangiaceae bacterium]